MVSGLRVNFHKSCIVGMNVDSNEVNMAAHFLYCRIGQVPFEFLGIPVGEILRLSSIWSLVIKKLRDRLSTWKRRQLSIGGRITFN